MPEYRAFIVGPDGHFSGFEEMVCDDDSKAIRGLNGSLTVTTWSFGTALV
jgi:hypothetical protein